MLLAPKRNCAECGKNVGRNWKEWVLCSGCVRLKMERFEKTTEKKDDIPY